MKTSLLRIIMVLLTASLCFALSAQVTVSGRVIGSDAPGGLGGARVSLVFGENNYTTQTQANGNFSMNNVQGSAQGFNYVLTISLDNYATIKRETRVQVTPVNLGNILMKELAWAPRNVEARLIAALNTVEVTWDAPEPNEGQMLSWSGARAGDIGSANPADWGIMHRFTPDDYAQLGVVEGMCLTSVRFIAMHPLPHTVKVYRGGTLTPLAPGELVFSQLVAGADIEPADWNELVLPVPVEILVDRELWFGVTTTTTADPEYLRPFGIDAGPAIANKGDLLFLNNTWQSMSIVHAIDRNFCIEGAVEFLRRDGSYTLTPSALIDDDFGKSTIKLNATITASTFDVGVTGRKSRRLTERDHYSPYYRELEGYEVYRVNELLQDDFDDWEYLDTVTDEREYADRDWANIEPGGYLYAVRAIYTGEVYSVPNKSPTPIRTDEFGGGDGSFIQPWEIRNAYHLSNVRNYLSVMHRNKCFVQVADIDLSEIPNWQRIGTSVGDSFQGKYDGNGYVISGLNIDNSTGQYQGLFGYVATPGEIKNLGIRGANVIVNGYSGILVGQNSGTISECYVHGALEVPDYHYGGGLVGRNEEVGRITNCYSVASVGGQSGMGGLVGLNYGTVANCFYVGYRYLTTSTNYGRNGLIGGGTAANTTNSYWDTQVSGTTTSTGGTGLTTAQMMQQASYAGWDFANTWVILEGRSYPSLRWDEDRVNLPGPTGFVATGGSRRVELSWNQYPGDIEGYNIYRNGALLNTDGPVTELSYIDEDVTIFVLYSYFIVAVVNIDDRQVETLPCVFQRALPYELEGEGTAESPFLIDSIEILNLLGVGFCGPAQADKHFKQTANINISGIANWSPIGASVPFQGKYNGDGFEIQGLRLASSQNYFGLFGRTDTGCILENIHLTDVNIYANGTSGTLVGIANNTIIRNCSVQGHRRYINSIQGGIIGQTTGNSSVYRCSANMSYLDSGSGGRAGGIVGYHNATGNIEECFAIVEMSSRGDNAPCTGGIVGQIINGSLVNCYVVGSIVTTQPQGTHGGLAGGNSRPIINCFAVVSIIDDGPGPIGGLVGQGTPALVQSSYWNTDLTGVNVSPGGGTPLNTLEMLDRDNYIGWNIGENQPWSKDENSFPYLTWEGEPGEHCIPPATLPPSDLETRPSEDNTQIILTWEPPTIMEPIGYRVYRDHQLISGDTLVEEETYSDRNPQPWTMHTYTVRAVYQVGADRVESADSGSAKGMIRIFNGGDGTQANPNIVETTQQFYGIRYGLDEYYRLNRDIDLREYANWVAIGERAFHFTGGLDGAGFEIRNMTRTSWESYFGLFGYVTGATIKNIHLTNVNVWGNSISGVVSAVAANTRFEYCSAQGTFTMLNSAKGGIAAQASGNTSFYRCWVDLTMNDNGSAGGVGGIVGTHDSMGKIEECFARVNMLSTGVNNPAAAGIVARLSNGSVENCYAFGTIRSTVATGQYGGIVGSGANRPVINCYAVVSSDMPGGTFGGVVGVGTPATVQNSYWDSEATGVRESLGGGESRMTRQMTRPYDDNTYVRWDFENIWMDDVDDINDDYPILAFQFVPTQLNTPKVTIETIERGGTQYVKLQWNAIEFANSYKVYATTNPRLPLENWNMRAHTGGRNFEEAIVLEDAPRMFYRVQALTAIPPDGRDDNRRRTQDRRGLK